MHTRSNGFGMNTYSLLTHVLYVNLGTVKKDPTFSSQKGTDVHLHHIETYAIHIPSSCQLILHYKQNKSFNLVLSYKQHYIYLFFAWYA